MPRNFGHRAGLWGALVAIFAYLHEVFVRPVVEWWTETVLGVWEESLLGVVRESFNQTSRTINGA